LAEMTYDSVKAATTHTSHSSTKPISTSQETGWEEHLQKDLFCVEWDVKA